MLLIDSPRLRKLLLQGNFGLERESLRVNKDGFLSHTQHPFQGNEHIVRDFCENQVEINTPVVGSPHEAVESLMEYDSQIEQRLEEMPQKEYLWPFSNPPYIHNEQDIPVAQFDGIEMSKTAYREYLSDRYGRYKMAFSGIHVNYSFNEELLQELFERSGKQNFTEYKNQLYLSLAKKAAQYGWILVAVTAASPLLDSSFVEKGRFDEDVFLGVSSVRCSEMGYWNFFVPVLDYSDVKSYADSIQKYVDMQFLCAPSELYYPVRLKPRGENNLENLRKQGINHIELRMFDLNPLAPCGIEEKDIAFVQLLLAWLVSIPDQEFTAEEQIQAVQNFKNAARYDLKTVKIAAPNGQVVSVVDAARKILSSMRGFYQDYPEEIQEILDFEENKFVDGENRYAWKIRKKFSGGFVKKGMQLAKKRQEEVHVYSY